MKNHDAKTALLLTIDLKPDGTRFRKIARLPASIRKQLNHRLSNVGLGKEILSWPNSLPKVNRIMAEQFVGKPISESNLSEWHRSGYQNKLQPAIAEAGPCGVLQTL